VGVVYRDLKVLLVEDNEKSLIELSTILKNYFQHIETAKNGEEGLQKALLSKYDIIITDIIMNKLDGFDMIEKIKQTDNNVKFIVVSGYTDKDFLLKSIEIGVSGYLIKPITIKQIEKTLQKVTNEIYTQKKLTQHIKEVEKLSQIKSEFLANMSHEIRTPLNAIIGFIKIMKDEDDGKFAKYLHIIDSASKTLLTIINDILDLSKLEVNQLKIEYINFSSSELYNTIELFEEKAKEKNINYKVKFINVPEYLYGDVHRLKQIIANLISNAIKFTPSNKTIEIKIKYHNEKLYVEVKDEGIGIPKDKIKKIFNAFSQADNSISRKYGGTGLGLTISYKLVKLLGGELKVESEPNKGSKFYFEIPIKVGSSYDDKIESNNNIDKNIKILIAEDNDANQVFMRVILNKLKLNFDIVSNGKEAVEYAKKHDYNLILMDIGMPIMDGITATKEIRKFSQIPIIALTASVLEEEKEKFLQSGMNDYLSKPLNISKLKEILHKYEHVLKAK